MCIRDSVTFVLPLAPPRRGHYAVHPGWYGGKRAAAAGLAPPPWLAGWGDPTELRTSLARLVV